VQYKPVIIAIVVLSALAFVSGYISQINRHSYDIYRHIKVSNCKIAVSSCKVDLGEGSSIQVNILPRGIPETEMLRISVDTQDTQIEALSVIFEGIEIDTITPEYSLYQYSDTRFIGNGSLAICSLDKMHWIAHFIVKKGGKNWKVSLPFEKDLTKFLPPPLGN
jgi:hypothetical protein